MRDATPHAGDWRRGAGTFHPRRGGAGSRAVPSVRAIARTEEDAMTQSYDRATFYGLDTTETRTQAQQMDANAGHDRLGAGLRRGRRGGGSAGDDADRRRADDGGARHARLDGARRRRAPRSEEHTSELQSRENLVCRLLLEKKKKKN